MGVGPEVVGQDPIQLVLGASVGLPAASCM